MSFWDNITQLRTILATETDSESPTSEELMSQVRENIESLFMLGFDSGVSGTATKDPSGTTETKFFDSTKTFIADSHNGRTLLVKSGAAIGNLYTIDDTLSGSTIVLTGDNLYADGVRSGDEYKILYDVKANLDGHDHNGVNSKEAVLSKGRIPVYTLPYTKVAELNVSNLQADPYLVDSMRVFVPAEGGKLYVAARLHSDGSHYAYCSLWEASAGMGGDANTSSATYVYDDDEVGLDLTGLSGWVTINVYLYTSDALVDAYLQGYTIVWGP